MLQHLSIKNYALINHLEINFSDGLTTITGETGSGKSILLGALGLVLGKRADLTILKDKEVKCIIEATFSLHNYKLKPFFRANDLDYEDDTIIRREILPSGKSRAFINDTPIVLSVLSQLGERLIDIHSQHQTMALSSKEFQFELLDAFAKNEKYLDSYKRGLQKLKTAQKELDELEKTQQAAKEMYDYNLHLFNELEQVKPIEGELEKLEDRLNFLDNVDTIKVALSASYAMLDNEEIGVQQQLFTIKAKFQQLANLSNTYETLNERIVALNIELLDIVADVTSALEEVDFDPSELTKVSNRLQLIYDLFKKHQVNTIAQLEAKHQELSLKVAVVENADTLLKTHKQKVQDITSKLNELTETIHQRRTTIIPKLTKQLTTILAKLGMHEAQFQIELTYGDAFFATGKDEINFLFSANKGTSFGELKKVASGGELSRIMLAVKTVLSKHKKLPTIIFDEIDTGVSGEVANQIAAILNLMAENMQVMAITHLAQIAAKGMEQLKVSKISLADTTETVITKLDKAQRIDEIAMMISGTTISDAAREHARTLLVD